MFTFYAQNDRLYFCCIIQLVSIRSIHFNSFSYKLVLSNIVVYLADLDQLFSFNLGKYKLLSSYFCQIYAVLGAKFTQIDILTISKLTLRFRSPGTSTVWKANHSTLINISEVASVLNFQYFEKKIP